MISSSSIEYGNVYEKGHFRVNFRIHCQNRLHPGLNPDLPKKRRAQVVTMHYMDVL
jgi:hypothetical protein